MSACKSTGKPVRWLRTTTGQLLPINPEPAPDGNILLLPHERCRVVPVEDRAATVAPLFKTHFATCPNAAAHRSKRR
jgi:hypothetical protein